MEKSKFKHLNLNLFILQNSRKYQLFVYMKIWNSEMNCENSFWIDNLATVMIKQTKIFYYPRCSLLFLLCLSVF